MKNIYGITILNGRHLISVQRHFNLKIFTMNPFMIDNLDQWGHHQVKEHKLVHLLLHHHLTFLRKHNKQAHLQWIQEVLEDVYSDTHMYG